MADRKPADYRGARGSNAGDQFHELWALRQVLRLLEPSSSFTAVTVEGVRYADAADGVDAPTWDGVDCALYYGGSSLETADVVEFAQLKYSGSSPDGSWTVARLVENSRTSGNNSVFRRLADDFKAAETRLKPGGTVRTKLVSNQPVADRVQEFVTKGQPQPADLQATEDWNKLRAASGLSKRLFEKFLKALDLSECGQDSRFTQEEKAIEALIPILGDDVGTEVDLLQAQVAKLMLPERTREFVDRNKLLIWFHVGRREALLPCPPTIRSPLHPIDRPPVHEVLDLIKGGERTIIVHGNGGCGKTTLTQQVARQLPTGSVAVTFDCYGSGSYLHSTDRRHLPENAFLQLTNDLALEAGLPTFIPRSGTHPATVETFVTRLVVAGTTLKASVPDGVILVIIDAADNAVTAANVAEPKERCFVRDLATADLRELPPNVHFLISARTSRKGSLGFAEETKEVACLPFTEEESRANLLANFPNATAAAQAAFHSLTEGNPRVQSYAIDAAGGDLNRVLETLLPSGKTLPDVIEATFDAARTKLGDRHAVPQLTAALAYLPRPAAPAAVARITEMPEALVRDFISDLRPGLKLDGNEITIADEDFEDYISARALPHRPETIAAIATYFLDMHKVDPYAAEHVVSALVSAGRVNDVFTVVDGDSGVQAIGDPIKKREVQIQRLALALATCRQTNDVVKSLQTLLIGAEAQRDEGAFYEVIDKELDLSVEFSGPSILPRTLMDRDKVSQHGSVMAHCALTGSRSGDVNGTTSYLRKYEAWIRKRPTRKDERGYEEKEWHITDADVASRVEAVFRTFGPAAAYREVRSWTPHQVALRVGPGVVQALLAGGHADKVRDLLEIDDLREPWTMAVAVPLAMAGVDIPASLFSAALSRLRRPHVPNRELVNSSSQWASDWLRTLVLACEIALSKNVDRTIVLRGVETILASIMRGLRALSANDAIRVDAVLRLWLLRSHLLGETVTAKAFIEYVRAITEPSVAPPPKTKGRRSRKKRATLPPGDSDRERLERRLAVLFPVYEARLSLLVVASQEPPGIAPDLSKLALGGNSYELDYGYEGHGLRFVMGRTVAETMFLPGSDVAKFFRKAVLLAGKIGGPFGSRHAALLMPFRLRGQFQPELIQWLDATAEQTRQYKARATEKVEEFVGLARFIMPMSVSDAEPYFNEALQVAKEIDEEAVDQIRFVSCAARAAYTVTPGQAPGKAGQFATFAAAAAIPLRDLDGFSWDPILEALVWMHPSTALACTGRWMDEGTSRLAATLLPFLRQALTTRQLNLDEVTALSLLVDGPSPALLRSIVAELHLRPESGDQGRIIEELARVISLTEGQHNRIDRAATLLSAAGDDTLGNWGQSLRDLLLFIKQRPRDEDDSKTRNSGLDLPSSRVADAAVPYTLPGSPSKESVETVLRSARTRDSYYHPTGIFTALGKSVRRLTDRVPLLDAITSIDGDLADTGDWSGPLTQLLREWNNPAVDHWAREKLPAIISRNLASLCRYIRFRGDNLDSLVAFTKATPAKTVDMLLGGVAATGVEMDSGALFAIAEHVIALLAPAEAERVLTWYLDRLLKRLPAEDRTSLAPVDVPDKLADAVPRFLFALMGDIDTRVRWRAAHAIRSLTRLQQAELVTSTLSQAGRREEPTFRSTTAPFYALGAKLWLMITAYRLSDESPAALASSKEVLVAAALETAVPHVVIREYAKRAAMTAEVNGAFSFTEEERNAILSANVPRKRARKNTQKNPHRTRDRGRDRASARYQFDEMDTVPYWYSNLTSIFPTVPLDKVLSMAERWIIDIWHAPTDQGHWVKEPRKGTRLDDDAYGWWSHSHWSFPTVERYSTYLEWHAMLCVAGELLVTAPVGAREYGEDRFDSWMERFLPTEPPFWLSDLRSPTPLLSYLWWQDPRTDKGWSRNVSRTEFESRLGLESKKSEWVIVASAVTSHHATREEHAGVRTTLVSPTTAQSLVNALQTASNAWDFGLPDEDDDRLEISTGPFELRGWLAGTHGDIQFDERDPLRQETRRVQVRPGKAAQLQLQLQSTRRTGVDWFTPGQKPSFSYVSWSDERAPEREYSRGTKSDGWQLLCRKSDLLHILTETDMFLICEISVDRTVRSQYRSSYDPDEKSIQHTKIILLKGDGTYSDVQGHVGAWEASRRRT